jgi:hypothetical protein
MPEETTAPEINQEESPIDKTIDVPIKYIVDLKAEIEVLKRSNGRPIRLPREITPGEFNALVDYLKEQRVMLLNIKGPAQLKKIEIKPEDNAN